MIVNALESNKTKPAFGKGSEIFHELKNHVLTKGSKEIPKELMDKAFMALLEAKKAKGEEISADKFGKAQKDLHIFMKSKAKAIEESYRTPVDMMQIGKNPFDPIHKSFDRLFGEQTLKLQPESPKTLSARAVVAASNAVNAPVDLRTSRSLFDKLKMHVSLNGVEHMPRGVLNEAVLAFVEAKKSKGQAIPPEKFERAKKDVYFFMTRNAYDIHEMLQNPKQMKPNSFEKMQKSFNEMFGIRVQEKAIAENVLKDTEKTRSLFTLITDRKPALTERKFGEQTRNYPAPPALEGKVKATFRTSPHINDGEPVFQLIKRKLKRVINPDSSRFTVTENSSVIRKVQTEKNPSDFWRNWFNLSSEKQTQTAINA